MPIIRVRRGNKEAREKAWQERLRAEREHREDLRRRGICVDCEDTGWINCNGDPGT